MALRRPAVDDDMRHDPLPFPEAENRPQDALLRAEAAAARAENEKDFRPARDSGGKLVEADERHHPFVDVDITVLAEALPDHVAVAVRVVQSLDRVR